MATIPQWVVRYADKRLPKEFHGKLELNFGAEGFSHMNVVFGVKEKDVQDLVSKPHPN